MLGILKSLSSPLTKVFLGVSIVLLLALAGTAYMSYKFYGNYIQSVAELEYMKNVAVELEVENNKLANSEKILQDNFIQTEKQYQKTSKEVKSLQDQLDSITNDQENVCSEDKIVNLDAPLPNDAVRLLERAHCLQDENEGDCTSSTSK